MSSQEAVGKQLALVIYRKKKMHMAFFSSFTEAIFILINFNKARTKAFT